MSATYPDRTATRVELTLVAQSAAAQAADAATTTKNGLIEVAEQLAESLSRPTPRPVPSADPPCRPVLRPHARLDVEQAREFVMKLDTETTGADPLRAAFLLRVAGSHLQSVLDVIDAVAQP